MQDGGISACANTMLALNSLAILAAKHKAAAAFSEKSVSTATFFNLGRVCGFAWMVGTRPLF